MGVILPNQKVWDPAHWVEMDFFENCIPLLDRAPSLSRGVQHCLDAEYASLDLSAPHPGQLQELIALVEGVISTIEAESFRDGGRETYLERIRDLRILIRESCGL